MRTLKPTGRAADQTADLASSHRPLTRDSRHGGRPKWFCADCRIVTPYAAGPVCQPQINELTEPRAAARTEGIGRHGVIDICPPAIMKSELRTSQTVSTSGSTVWPGHAER